MTDHFYLLGTPIQILKEDIEYGKSHNPPVCPVSLAIHRVLEDGGSRKLTINADHDVVIVDNGADVSFYNPPNELSQFVKDYDDGQEVEPLAFCLSSLADE